jgi:hypothetical protein
MAREYEQAARANLSAELVQLERTADQLVAPIERQDYP